MQISPALTWCKGFYGRYAELPVVERLVELPEPGRYAELPVVERLDVLGRYAELPVVERLVVLGRYAELPAVERFKLELVTFLPLLEL